MTAQTDVIRTEDENLSDFEPYDVTCARCGKVLSCVDAVAEEGDEWECGPCNTRCNEEEARATGDEHPAQASYHRG